MNLNDYQPHAPEPEDVRSQPENRRPEDQQAPPDGLPLTEEELKRYRALLAMAYPGPKTSLKEGVLGKIQAEKARKRHLRRRCFVRYGSMAACLVLLAAAVAVFTPYLSRCQDARTSNDTTPVSDTVSEPMVNSLPAYASTEPAQRTNRAENSRDVSDGSAADGSASDGSESEGEMPIGFADGTPEDAEAPALTREDAVLGASLYQLHRDASDGSLSEEITGFSLSVESEGDQDTAEEAFEEASEEIKVESEEGAEAAAGGTPILEVPSMDTDCEIPENEPLIPESPAANSSAVNNSPAMDQKAEDVCTPESCSRHSDTYHTFSKELIDFAGEDSFAAWVASEKAADDCGLPSAATFARDFSLDRAAFAGLVESSDVRYDLDEIFPEQ